MKIHVNLNNCTTDKNQMELFVGETTYQVV